MSQHQHPQQSFNNYHHVSRNNIESLQLPPNPVGPYMRQNREQLLAKQQILEQYARQQKQMQIQQQQQNQPQGFQKLTHGMHSMHNNPRVSSMRQNMNSGGLDRVSSTSVPPPGLGNPMPKYDLLPDRPERNYFHRSLSQQHQQRGNPASQYPFGMANLNSGISNIPQSRSIGDIRMDNGSGVVGMGMDQGFTGSNDRNPYREHFNQFQQDVFSSKY